MSKTFKEQVAANLGCAVILAGSGSDEPHIDKIAKALKNYDIPFEVRIASAHKQSKELLNLIALYDSYQGALAYIAVAGGTDALSGTLSWHSYRPTVSCPPDHPNQSCINNPPGSSNAYIGKPDNAARFIAQMFSTINPHYQDILRKENEKKIEALEASDEQLFAKYLELQGPQTP